MNSKKFFVAVFVGSSTELHKFETYNPLNTVSAIKTPNQVLSYYPLKYRKTPQVLISSSFRQTRIINHKEKVNKRNQLTNTQIKTVLVIGQFFAALPLSGITSKSAKSLAFTMKSFRVLYTIIISLASAFMGVITFYWSTSLTLKFENMGEYI